MQDDQIDLVFKALAHRERRRILASLLTRPEQSLFEICASSIADGGLALSRQTISQHLETLEASGLVEVVWKGRTKVHSVNLVPLRKAMELTKKAYL
ncbi:MAG TPA: transcriptional regulator [Alphaproteobacteria bacterium]|nr:transcriptional regulator [Alphaproteobacteria bacterium]HAJ45987.1 transcriptional regulator [Alphaproteobacteria bacterium]